jgi:uncharacterized membrane protein YkvA (DUF1232 family)
MTARRTSGGWEEGSPPADPDADHPAGPHDAPAAKGLRARLRRWTQALRRDLAALYLAARDPRVPWYAKALAAATVAYALSPIDLIPDFIPILGYLDDLLILPLGIALAIRLIPPALMAELREAAAGMAFSELPGGRAAAALILVLWLAAVVLVLRTLAEAFGVV